MGIARKTFLFTAALIALVVVVSLGILYLILPDYYFRSKSARMQSQSDALKQNLQDARTQDECAALIKDFSTANNAVVLSFEPDDTMIPELSTPFLSLGPAGRVQVIAKDEATAGANGSVIESFRISGAGPVNVGENGQAAPDPGMLQLYSTVSQISIIKSIQSGFMDHIYILGTMQPVGEATKVIISLMPYLLALDLLIALAAAYLFSKRLTRPILQLSRAASQMRGMSPGAASGIKTRDEIGDLSKNLDLLYQSLCANIETLRQEKEMVNRLEQAKTDFMRAASHELKTPITALNGIVEGMIDNVGVYKNKEKYLQECKNLIDRLSGLVGEILNAAAMDGSSEPTRRRPVNIDNMLERALSEYRVLSEEKCLRIETDIRPIQIDTDETVLLHTILNLISNAVKYTPRGGLIRIRLFPDGGGHTLSIENDCEPIPEGQIAMLFEPFYTLSYSRDKNRSGAGLGLYIVRRNLDRLHLAYGLRNTGAGLNFTINFH